MSKKHVKFEYQGAEVKLPIKTIIKNWLERSVLGTTPLPAERFTVNGDGTVTDHHLKVRWTQATVAKSVTAQQAEEVLKQLSEKHGGKWRFATVKEMSSLVDHDRHEPAINTDIFPDTDNSPYWTGTPTSWNSSAVWVVFFHGGYVSSHHRNVSACLRAVCELPAGQ